MEYVIVTGSYGGMGSETVKKLVALGYTVFAFDMNVKPSEKGVIPIKVLINKLDSVKMAYNEVLKYTNKIKAIIHFAGIYELDSLVEISEERFKNIMEINFFGPFYVNKTFLPLLQADARIIITTSELAPLDPLPFTGIYAISKAALDKYAYSLRMELQLLNIKVSVLRAGAVKTKLLDTSTTELDNFVNNTKLYKCNAQRFKAIVQSVEAQSIMPTKLASKVIKILNQLNPKFDYHINRNFYLRLLNILPHRLQFFIIKQILK